jgi:eukaryotic-like serine/threonine-protein kinase
MPLESGAKLGPYEISGKLGAGGMGEVWKARDPRLDRTVAIKVSAEKFSERFEREARAVAALNHPNICQIYDVGPDYIVLEYVEGSPVAPTANTRKLLDIAVQIADGMAAAHAAGFVHRDLKPANVLVTPEGRVKILDFGLVKTLAKPDAGDATQALTLTDPGMVAGTAAYMSPEQASGSQNLDARSDQFSLGLMLYEMASGKHAFKRSTAVETLAAIIREDPEPLPASVPAPLRWIIHRCLAKEPRDRYESSRDLFLELRSLREHLADSSSSSTTMPAMTAVPKRRKAWGVAIGFALGAVLAASAALLLRPATPRPASLRYTPFSFEQGGQTSPVWSPDGKAVAFAGRQKITDPMQVYVRYLDSPVATQLTHIPEPAIPVDWTSTGRIIFRSLRAPVGLWSVSPVGGEPEPFAAMNPSEANSASVSRDGSAVASFHKGDDGLFGVWISSPPGSAPKPYQPAPFAFRTVANSPQVKFSPDGKQLLLIRNAGAGEQAWLMPYPANSAQPPHRILQNFPAFGGTPTFSWMPDNRRIVISTVPAPGSPNQLYLADTVSGEFSVLSSGTTAQVLPAASPDGSKLVFLEAAADYDIVSVDLATALVTPLIATQRSEEMPAWASREEALVYVTDRSGEPEIWLHKPGQPDRPLVTKRDFPPDTTQWFMSPVLSPDASRVIYTRIERAGSAVLWISATAGGSPVRLVKSCLACYGGSWSPDGNWFVYWDVQEGRTSLNKVKTTGQAEPEVLKADMMRGGPWVPVWSPAGDWILHSDGGPQLTSPDGKTTRRLAAKGAIAFAFSADGKTVYGIRQVADNRGLELFSVSIATGTEKMIGSLGREYLPASPLTPGLRLSLTPDSKSVTYSIVKSSANLWLVDGLPAGK